MIAEEGAQLLDVLAGRTRWCLLQGDCRVRLGDLVDCAVDAVVTDPPYELGFMGKAWDSTGIAYSVEMWREVLRVLKPGGHMLAFGGTRTSHRMVCAIEDAGFEVRDSIAWMYGTGFPKSLNVSKAIDEAAGATREVISEHPLASRKPRAHSNAGRGSLAGGRLGTLPDVTAPATDAARQWNGWGTALKPALEPICLARKPLIGTVAANVLAHGTGGLNIDGCRVSAEGLHEVTQGKGTHGEDGWGMERSRYRVPTGRWPANVILDDEAAAVLDAQSGISKSPRVGSVARISALLNQPSKGDEQARVSPNGHGDAGGASRFFYTAKPSRAERDLYCDELPAKSGGEATARKDGSDGLNSPRAGAGRTGGARNHHPTVKPIELMRYLVRLITPPGGIVLDPFVGSGSGGAAALAERCRFIGIDQDADFIAIARARLARNAKQATLFDMDFVG